MRIIRDTRDWFSFAAYVWRTARKEEDGGITDDTAMIALMGAAAVGIGLALGPWLAGKISTFMSSWG